MKPAIALETELRHAVIDRLIAASMRDGTPARDASLERYRSQAQAKIAETPKDA
jgi:hypothetical protein